MAEIFRSDSSRKIQPDELIIEFANPPAFRRNHGIETPGLVGIVRAGTTRVNAYLPCRDESDAELLTGALVAFPRLARHQEIYFVDTRPSEEFWNRTPKKNRPAVGDRVYNLPSNQQPDGAEVRKLIIADIARSANQLIGDYEAKTYPNPMDHENPFMRVRQLISATQAEIHHHPKPMLDDIEALMAGYAGLSEQMRLLSHLATMNPHFREIALRMAAEPEQVWRQTDLIITHRPQHAGKGDLWLDDHQTG